MKRVTAKKTATKKAAKGRDEEGGQKGRDEEGGSEVGGDRARRTASSSRKR
jgi:hypothetical protein